MSSFILIIVGFLVFPKMALEKGSQNNNLHYKGVSDNYHKAFFYTGAYEEWQLDVLLKKMDLKKTDLVADVGGGTGRFASLIHKSVKLENSIVCVDPSADMLEMSDKMVGVDSVRCNAREFASRKEEKIYDCILFKEVVHHLSEEDLKIVFSCLHKKLSDTGKILICTRPQIVNYPFFKAAHEVWKKNQPSKEYYVGLLEAAGYKISSVTVPHYWASMDMSWWISMVRNRFWSTFSAFSDTELELGIREIIEQFGEMGNIRFQERLVLIVAVKNI